MQENTFNLCYRTMKCPVSYIIFLTLFAAFSTDSFGQDSLSKFDAYADMLYTSGKKIYQDVYYQSGQKFPATVHIVGYYYKSNEDSLRMFENTSRQVIPAGTGILKVGYFSGRGKYYLHPDFSAILTKKDLIIPGQYKIRLQVINTQSKQVIFENIIQREIDSAIRFSSALGKGIANILSKFDPGKNLNNSAKQLRLVSGVTRQTERYFKRKGFSHVKYVSGDTTTIELYYQNWFVGKYEINSRNVNSSIDQAKRFTDGVGTGLFADNQLESYQSLMAQMREMKKDMKDNNEMSGIISAATNYSTGQEEYSEQDDFYYELSGSVDVPIFNMPVTIEGYYTSQDRKREAKASYIRMHYDVDKAKEQLSKLISSYNQRAGQTVAQSNSLDMIYGNLLNQLNQEKERTIAQLRNQIGADLDFTNMDAESFRLKAEAALKEKMEQAAEHKKTETGDSLHAKISNAEGTGDAKEKVSERLSKATATYQKIIALQEKIGKYKKMLEQYKQVLKYDTLLAYNKLEHLQDPDKMSYKDMVKSAANILPNGKTKSFMTGLTNLDAGIFSKSLSNYTFSGQTLKGIDIGYDIGFSTVGASYGTVEYIGRTGAVEQYKTYSGRVQFKPVFNQQVAVIYYGYSPSKRFLSKNDFFKHTDVSLPGFRNPVHILSTVYSGNIGKNVLLQGEFAYSDKQDQSKEAAAGVSFKDRISYKITADGQIPQTGITIGGEYEIMGKDFENNTLPYIMSGIEKYTLSGKGAFFRSFLTLGVEYASLVQNNLYSKNRSSKWGFDIGTHSRRYPTLYIAYKPFSTFRSFDDTLAIAQKPLMGEVWTGRVNYQYKKGKNILRLTALYNKNTNTADTVTYSASMTQFSVSYAYNKSMAALSIGSNRVNTNLTDITYPLFNNTLFTNFTFGAPLLASLFVTTGVDLAKNESGICRYGVFTGASYNFKKIPVMLRANLRYSSYRLTEGAPWKNLYSGGLEVAWRFRLKLYDHFK